MKVTIQPNPEEIELTDEQVSRLCDIAQRTDYYWTQGKGGELLDELAAKGLVYAGCGGGSDEQYRLTNKGILVFKQVPLSVIKNRKKYYDEEVH